LAREFERGGYRRVEPSESTDVAVINSCSVTEHADKKCRNIIRKIHRRNPNAIIAVTGCYAQLKPQDIAAIEGVDLVLSNNDKGDLFRRVEELSSRGKAEVYSCSVENLTRFFPAYSSADRTRSFLKVQDGCDYKCAYCTIHYARGASRNMPIADIVAEAEEIASLGQREIVITGVNIGDFGKHTNENFYDLIRALDEVEGIERYRISSIEPELLTDEMIDFVAQSKRFCRHFHIPLQSGSDEVLKLMRRRYDTALFAHKVEKIKSVMPDAFIGVDVIAGMRGETIELFEEAYRFIESLDVTQLHVFTYSERPNTKALAIEPVVDVRERHERCNKLIELSDAKLRKFYDAYQGTERTVLFEQPAKGMPMHGFTDNYIRVEMPYNREAINKVCRVRLGEMNEAGDALLAYNID
jgi:threonylcarbamoyladenosine tRNA methylthiotransferase MtaB